MYTLIKKKKGGVNMAGTHELFYVVERAPEETKRLERDERVKAMFRKAKNEQRAKEIAERASRSEGCSSHPSESSESESCSHDSSGSNRRSGRRVREYYKSPEPDSRASADRMVATAALTSTFYY